MDIANQIEEIGEITFSRALNELANAPFGRTEAEFLQISAALDDKKRAILGPRWRMTVVMPKRVHDLLETVSLDFGLSTNSVALWAITCFLHNAWRIKNSPEAQRAMAETQLMSMILKKRATELLDESFLGTMKEALDAVAELGLSPEAYEDTLHMAVRRIVELPKAFREAAIRRAAYWPSLRTLLDNWLAWAYEDHRHDHPRLLAFEAFRNRLVEVLEEENTDNKVYLTED